MIDTRTASLRCLCLGWRQAANQDSGLVAAERLNLSADVIEQLAQERDRLAAALRAALVVVVATRDGFAESGDCLRLTAGGDVEPIPGTMDAETAKTVATLDHIAAQCQAALAGGAS